MNKNIVVFGSTFERASNKLQEMLNEMKYGEVEMVRKGKNEFTISLVNGDRYIIVGMGDSARGYRWQYAYIDKQIPQEILHSMVWRGFSSYSESYQNTNLRATDCCEYFDL